MLTQVCDGYPDCKDHSDECICNDIIEGNRITGCRTADFRIPALKGKEKEFLIGT